jgi:hypothetical protein
MRIPYSQENYGKRWRPTWSFNYGLCRKIDPDRRGFIKNAGKSMGI